MSVISIEHLTKQFKKHTALHDLSLTIRGTFGLLGPNGAGKTTLMKILATILKPTSGRITYEGLDWSLHEMKVKQLIGYLPQHFSAYRSLNVNECLDHIAVLKGIKDKKERQSVIQDILSQVNLSEQSAVKIKHLSGGMMRRLGIAQALLGDPKILIVDEPTAGLDVEERARFRRVLKRLSKDRIIILSTHIVEDIETVCTNAGIINHGKFIQQGSLKDLIQLAENKVWKKVMNDSELDTLEEKHIISINIQEGEQVVRFLSDDPPEHSEPCTPTLEDAYLYLIRNDKH
ncbi:ABC-type multidrug transport system ATPase subunit [Melghiribacillus thermohalophilus]|uniref:ABC-type multidrug transport system ATPase subunit n=1 Tax=Melghiribacillus thermohalophilus TaxID=1324956 RepID=A0A4R3N590_9BACI|nr:ABC transporter ATP-binding protein [Melghiribacillus thermohalophilus]TCT23597.1 ABC-type multidrug transport system ATPase subunit [Melghiribacillus thermohalophilus]